MTQLNAAPAPKRESTPPADRVRLGLLVIGRKRPGFDQEWNGIMRAGALGALDALGYDCVGHETPVADDQMVIAALDQIRASGAEALVVLQPSLGNGQLALTVGQRWPQPVVLWATPERAEGEKVSSCSLVAQHLWGSIFRQQRHPFELVVGDPAKGSLRQTLDEAIRLCRTIRKLRGAKLGVIGSSAPGFIPMQADPFTLRRDIGTQLQSLSLVQFIERAKLLDEADVKADVDRVAQMRLPMNSVKHEDLAINSRYYLAMKQIIAEEKLDALAIQCWPELPNVMEQWPYLALSRLADEGLAVAMEGDADGALLCLAARILDAGPGFITDWLEHDQNTITLWHPGTAPMSMCRAAGSENGASLGVHFNIAKPIVIDGQLRENEPVTIARLWRCDDRYHLMAFEGRSIPMSRRLTGNTAKVEVTGGDVPDWFDTLCHAGMPHHPVLFYGHHCGLLRRLARMLAIHWIEKT